MDLCIDPLRGVLRNSCAAAAVGPIKEQKYTTSRSSPLNSLYSRNYAGHYGIHLMCSFPSALLFRGGQQTEKTNNSQEEIAPGKEYMVKCLLTPDIAVGFAHCLL